MPFPPCLQYGLGHFTISSTSKHSYTCVDQNTKLASLLTLYLRHGVPLPTYNLQGPLCPPPLLHLVTVQIFSLTTIMSASKTYIGFKLKV